MEKKNLKTNEAFWRLMKKSKSIGYPKEVVFKKSEVKEEITEKFDIAILGGGLGLFVATYFQKQGFKVCIIERNDEIKGRIQEWNISKEDLEVLSDLNILTDEEIEKSIVSDFSPVRIEFFKKGSYSISDALNLGVSPESLISSAKIIFFQTEERFLHPTNFRP